MFDTKINVEFARQIAPYFVFFDRVLALPREIFLFPISYGYGYFLRRIITRYDGINTQSGKLAPPLFIEFMDNWNGRTRQIDPIPLPLISTPNNGGNTEYEVQTMVPHSFTVKTPRTSEKILNFFHPYADIIRFYIIGGGTPLFIGSPGAVYPSVEILLEGYYVPEKSLSLWTKYKQGQAKAKQRARQYIEI